MVSESNRRSIRQWNRTAKKCLKSNDQFRVERRGGFNVFRRTSREADQILAALLPDPDALLNEGTLLPGRGNSCRIARVTIGGKEYVLKRYDRRGWVYSFRHIFRRSRALRTWLVAWNLLVRGFSVPEPVVCLEERAFRMLARSYILSEFVADSSRLSDLWPAFDDQQKGLIVKESSELFGGLHRRGCVHGDTNWDNMLLQKDRDRFRIWLVDFDCAKIFTRIKPQKAEKDIQHYLRDLRRLDGDSEDLCKHFVDVWRKAMGAQGVS